MDVLVNVNGSKLKTRFKVGEKAGSLEHAIKKLKKSKEKIISIAPPNAMEEPAKGIVTPVFNDQNEIVAIIIFVRDMIMETNIEKTTSAVSSEMFQLNEAIKEVSSNTGELASLIKELEAFSQQTFKKR